jgi:hypothetical protein
MNELLIKYVKEELRKAKNRKDMAKENYDQALGEVEALERIVKEIETQEVKA